MNYKKLLTALTIFTAVSLMAFIPLGFSEEASTDEVYNPKDEVLYGYRALLERQETNSQRIQFQRYQQAQYLEQQRLMDKQNMYNQSHQKANHPDS